jgi:hypothetical protein
MKTLTGWCDFAKTQALAIEGKMEARRTGIPLLAARSGVHRIPAARELMAEYMMAESALHDAALERAVNGFITDGRWPELSDEELFYLLFRLVVGQQAVDLLSELNGEISPIFLSPPPSTDDNAAFLRWLYIDVWHSTGAQYLRGWAAEAWRLEDARRNMPPQQKPDGSS